MKTIKERLKLKEKDIRKIAKDKFAIFYLWYFVLIDVLIFLLGVYQGIQYRFFGYTDFDFALSTLIVALFYGILVILSIFLTFRFIRRRFPVLMTLLVMSEAIFPIFILIFWGIYEVYSAVKLIFVIYLLVKTYKAKRNMTYDRPFTRTRDFLNKGGVR